MQFSTGSFFLVVTFYVMAIAITFSMDNLIGLSLMTFLSLIVLPPFVQVGVFTTKGFRRAFFIGAAFGGTPHFIIAYYYLLMFGMGGAFAGFTSTGWFESNETHRYLMLGHLIGILIASFGGLSGCVSYGLLHGFHDDTK